MCGLLALRANGAFPDLARVGTAALDTLAHRGPDDADWMEIAADMPPTFLGHRRLSILDLSDASRQPMTCPVTGNVLLFNGEIYNFIELRHELETRGCVFRTQSDTETILHAWRVWGEDAFARFNGMWAVVLLDRTSGTLICCRDRLGIKPLYYARDPRPNGMVSIFASEIRAIAAVLGGHPEPNRQAVFDFLLTGLSEHKERTFYTGISSIPAGWIMRLDRQGEIHWQRYHQWPECDPHGQFDPEQLRDLLYDAVRLRLRSDAPSVTLLSGGLDSSIITALAARAAQTEPRTCHAGAYTYGYRDDLAPAHDETACARAFIAEYLPETRHVIRFADPCPDEEELLALARAQEEPVATPSVLAAYRLYGSIRRDGIKVVLSGEGADELFGGYTTRYMSLLARDRILAGQLRPAWTLLRNGTIRPQSLANQLVWTLPAHLVRRMLRQTRPSSRMMSAALWHDMSGEFDKIYRDRRLNLEQRLHRDVTATNLPMILRWADRNSMHFGVEVRSPYLDWRVVSLALSTPPAQRMGDDHGKAALRRAFAGQLPEQRLWQRKTHGFGNAEQYQVNAMRFETLWERLPTSANELLDVPRLRRELARSGSHTTLWWSVSLALWLAAVYGEGR